MDFERLFDMIKMRREVIETWGRRIMRITFVVALSYVVASSASAYFMSVMLDSVLHARSKMRPDGMVASVDMGTRPNYVEIRNAVLDRNIFNATGEFPDETIADESDGESSTASDFDPNAACQKTGLNITLKGTIYQTQGENSIAIVQESGYGEADVYREGDAIYGADNAVITKIERQFVVINNSGKKECLELKADDSRNKDDGFPSVPPVAGGRPDPVPPAGGGGECLLDEKYVQEQLGDGFANIMSQGRLVPNTTNNQMNGFKIFAIQKNGLWGKVGFNNGDVITQVNDVSLKQPDQGFALYQAFQDDREVRIELLRGGKTPTSIVCRLK